MNVGVLSDIHANLPALEAVLKDMPPVDAIVNAGDIVGYNPWPAACVERVREHDMHSIAGNHDRAVVAGSSFRFNHMAAAGVEHAQDELDSEQIDWLGGLHDSQLLLDGQIKLVHGHPADPDRYTYPSAFSPSMLDDEAVLVLGHTHVQHAETYADGIICNPGSVGQPRDGDPRAAYALLDLEGPSIELCRVEYDIKKVQEEINRVGLPQQIGDRLADGK